ncbi:hypothetical protein PL75_01145 [Neisseria arctica]|uniref:Uncharacterized protein n=1 Tax=Neisseria arctica TaxID=1470200 RepID=A0A0J0YTY5_9NEIS|nr:hypothetical protein [Neisseria arctica]KLT73587.1 hypothetical protein PL75_01145 [Neisseria arctica]UOO85707.1 hypothetical protein LVJ86_05555 [Neisseria arctica]
MSKHDSSISKINSTLSIIPLAFLTYCPGEIQNSNYIKEVSNNYGYSYNRHCIMPNSYSPEITNETISIGTTYTNLGYDESNLLKIMNVFLVDLLSKQESLEDEFAKVLFNNIDELYQG